MFIPTENVMTIAKFADSPPYFYLKQIHLHCPLAAETYDYLWEKRDNNNCVMIVKVNIPNETYSTFSRFMSNVRSLGREGLLNFWEDNRHIKIELVGWDQEEFE